LIVDYQNSYFNTIVNFNQNINLYANLGVNSKTVTPTQLSYLANVTGDIQSQINNLTSGGASFGSNVVMNNNKIFLEYHQILIIILVMILHAVMGHQ